MHIKALVLETPKWKPVYHSRARELILSRLEEHSGFNDVAVRRVNMVTVHCIPATMALRSQVLTFSLRFSVFSVAKQDHFPLTLRY